MSYRYLRYSMNAGGLYVARDLLDQPGPGPSTQPQHLVLDENGDPRWANHPIGGKMQPLVPVVVPSELCFECTKHLDADGDCFECGTGKHCRDCTCIHNDWLCPYHQDGHACSGVPRGVDTSC